MLNPENPVCASKIICMVEANVCSDTTFPKFYSGLKVNILPEYT